MCADCRHRLLVIGITRYVSSVLTGWFACCCLRMVTIRLRGAYEVVEGSYGYGHDRNACGRGELGIVSRDSRGALHHR